MGINHDNLEILKCIVQGRFTADIGIKPITFRSVVHYSTSWPIFSFVLAGIISL